MNVRPHLGENKIFIMCKWNLPEGDNVWSFYKDLPANMVNTYALWKLWAEIEVNRNTVRSIESRFTCQKTESTVANVRIRKIQCVKVHQTFKR
jgi:hypothetical protein